MKSTKLLSSSIAAALLTSVATPVMTHADSTSFKDLSTNSIYYEDVQWLVGKGIIGGFEDQTFRPNEPLTREQAASMFVRALKLDTPANASSIISRYSDISGTSWSADSLAAFINAEISDDDGSFAPKSPLHREVMASWLVNAFDFTEISNEDVPFTDAGQISSSHLPNVKILYQNKIVGGKTDGTFGPKDAVTRAQFTAFMKRALLKYEAAWDKEKVETEEKAEKVPFEILEADTLNLQQVKLVTKSTAANRQHLSKIEHYRLEDVNGKVIKVVDAQVNEKEIILTLEKALKNRDKANLIVAASLTGEEEDFKLSFKDNVDPELVSVTPTSPYSYIMTFSEPLDFGVENGEEIDDDGLFDSLEIDGDKYIIKRMTVLQYGQALHVELKANLNEGGHELELLETDWFKDYVGNELDTEQIHFNMKYDTALPKLLQVKNPQPTQVTLVFDKLIKLRNQDYIYHTSSAHYPKKATVQNGNELVLTFDSKHLITKSTDIVVDDDAIEDLWGNKNTNLTKTIEIQEDNTPPTIETIQFMDSTVASSSYVKMKVTFSESVKKKVAADIDIYELKDQQGNVIKIKDIAFENSSTNDKIATFTIDKYYGDVPNQRFTIKVDDLEDLIGNESGRIEYKFTASSEKAPGDFTGKMVLNGREDEVLIAIDFGKEMADSGDFSVNELEKYQLSVGKKSVLLDDLSKVSGLDVSISTVQDAQSVEIVVKKKGKLADAWDDFFDDLVEAIDDEELDDLELIIGRVADQNGNKTESIVNNVKLSVQSRFEKSQVTAKATDVDTIELSFEDELKNFNEDDFIVFYDRDQDRRFDSREELDTKMSINTKNGASVITIKLKDEELDSDGRFKNKDVYVVTTGNVKTKNRFGQEIEFSSLRVADGIAPKIATYRGNDQVYVQSIRNDSSRAIVSIELTDDIDKNTLTRLSFVIGDGKEYEIESMFVENGNIVCFVVKLGGNRVEDLVGEYIKQRAAISDENDNIVKDINTRINEERNSRTNP